MFPNYPAVFLIYFVSTAVGNNPSSIILWDLPLVRISPEWVRSPEQGKSSSRTATFILWTDMFWGGISCIADETIMLLWRGRQCFIVGTGCSMSSCEWLLGRRGYGITHCCPFYPSFLLCRNVKIKRYIQNYTFACCSVRALNELFQITGTI